MAFIYFNAIYYTVENALVKVRDEQGMKRVEKFLRQDICPSCHGGCLRMIHIEFCVWGGMCRTPCRRI